MDAFALVRTTSPKGRYLAIGFLADNRTGDPTAIPAVVNQTDEVTSSTWQVSLECVNQALWMSGDIMLSSAGGSFDQTVKQTYGAKNATLRIVGTYNPNQGTISGTITISFTDGTGDVRQDVFAATLTNGDTGWIATTMQSCVSPAITCHQTSPCPLEIRLKKS